jgi:hypothetical protein
MLEVGVEIKGEGEGEEVEEGREDETSFTSHPAKRGELGRRRRSLALPKSIRETLRVGE